MTYAMTINRDSDQQFKRFSVSSSSLSSYSTATSTSTVTIVGIGSTSARAIRSLGVATIRGIDYVVIRARLNTFRKIVQRIEASREIWVEIIDFASCVF